MAILRISSYRTLNYTGISGAFAAVGSPVDHNWRAFCITNNTDGDLIFSVDGTTNNMFIPAYSFRLYDIATNAAPLRVGDNLLVQLNTQFYVKQSTAPTVGDVYIEGIYARGE